MGTLFGRVLREFADAFTTTTRSDGSKAVVIKDSAPAWLQSYTVMRAIHESIDDRLPDDWIFEETRGILGSLVDYEIDSLDGHEDKLSEIADGRIDVYNSDRSAWLASHLGNAALCDEAVSDGLVSADADIFDRIGSGQYVAATRMIGAIMRVIDEETGTRAARIVDNGECPDDLAEIREAHEGHP